MIDILIDIGVSVAFGTMRFFQSLDLLARICAFIWVVVQGSLFYNDYTDPVDPNYYHPIALTVPNYCFGDDPKITYTREIPKGFIGGWRTYFTDEARQGFPVCASAYQPWIYEKRPKDTIQKSLNDFILAPQVCTPGPGNWRFAVDWTVRAPWHHPKAIHKESNAFEIISKSDPLCASSSQPN